MTVLSLHSGAKSLKYFANAGVQFGEEGTMAAALEIVSPILAVGNETFSLAGVHTSDARVHIVPFLNSIDFSPKHVRNDANQMIFIAFI